MAWWHGLSRCMHALDTSRVHAQCLRVPQAGGHVYICGATAMGRDVVALLTQIYVEHGGQSEADAAATVKVMAAQGRLVQELWS